MRADAKRSMFDVSPRELGEWLHVRTQPSFRVDQVLEWVYARRISSFDEMDNVPIEIRRELGDAFTLDDLRVAERQTSKNGDAGKILFELRDGARIESVWMKDEDKYTFCISTQVGCPLDCRFCATGLNGYVRDLTTGEVLGQVASLARETGGLRNIVFMGMGEPLLNMEALVPALDVLTNERCFALGARRITVSTAGIVPEISRLATGSVKPNLAVSLNSPFNEQRSNLMPVNKRYPIKDVLQACGLYASRTGRRITIEYVMLGGVNTSVSCARRLGKIAAELGALVNLIALNRFDGCFFQSPTRDEIGKFRAALVRRNITVTQRYRRGRDISAACGQLTSAR